MSWYDRQAPGVDEVYQRKYCVFYQKDPARSYDTSQAMRLLNVEPQPASLEQKHVEEQSCAPAGKFDDLSVKGVGDGLEGVLPRENAVESMSDLQDGVLAYQQAARLYGVGNLNATQQKLDIAEPYDVTREQIASRPASAVEEAYNPYFRKYDVFYQSNEVVGNSLRSEIQKKKKEWEEQRLAAEDKDTFKRKYEQFYLDQEQPGLSATVLFRKHNESSIGFIDRSLRESAGDRPRSAKEPKELAGFEGYASRVSFRKRK